MAVRQHDAGHAKLSQDLTTSAAGRDRHSGIRHDGNRQEFTCPGSDRRTDRHSLCAVGEPVGNILHVATGKNPAIGRQQGRTHRKIRVGRVSRFTSLPRHLNQRVPIHGGNLAVEKRFGNEKTSSQ